MTGDQQFAALLVTQGVTALASILAFLAGVLAYLKSRTTESKVAAVHESMNGMKDALVKATGESEHAAGVVEGTRQERANPMSPAGS